MKAILYYFLFFGAFTAFLVICQALTFAYAWLRRKINKPRIGFVCFLQKLLKDGDYVSINGKVLRFSHIARNGETIDPIRLPSNYNQTLGGELAFYDLLGYKIYESSALIKCDFIYGKYGLKWAASSHIANTADEKIKEAKDKTTLL